MHCLTTTNLGSFSRVSALSVREAGRGLTLEPPGQSSLTVSVSNCTSGLCLGTNFAPNSQRQMLLLGSYLAFTAREQSVRGGLSLPFPSQKK